MCVCASLHHCVYAALYKLLENAVGTDHAVFRATHGFACGVQSYTDSHLRLLRQEQLILLAENERLQAQVSVNFNCVFLEGMSVFKNFA